MAPGCAHCPVVLEALSRLLKEGALGRLEVVNIAAHPEIAQEIGTRSVPWTRIGPFELTGAHSHQELARWASLAAQGKGTGPYYSQLLDTRRLDKVIELIRARPDTLHELIALLSEEDTPLTVRVGVGAVLETFQDGGLLERIVPDLEALTRSPQPHTRADACYYLGLTGDPRAIPTVRALLEDGRPEVREIARETLETLQGSE
jgi:hypothetical protein